MARKKITTIEEETERPELDAPELERPSMSAPALEMSAAERIEEIRRRGELDEVTSRIYKINAVNSREFVGKVEDVIDEDYIAENYGAGKYLVIYAYKESGVWRSTTRTFAISSAYRAKTAAPVQAAAPVQNNPLGAILGGLTAEKIAGIVAAVQGLKAIFAPPPPPVDMTELIKALAAPRQNVGDAVLIKALEGVNRPAVQPPAAPSIIQQIKDLQQVKELLGAENEQTGDNMNFIIEQGLKLLPALLQKNAGNFNATGAAVKDNPIISGLIEKDPELLADFCGAVKDKYGEQAARDLAAGYGYALDAEPAAAIEQVTTEQQGAPAPAQG